MQGRHPGHQAAGFTAEERALVQSLALGGTDDIAARRLGISTRTLRRRVAALMTRLDATSRFQVAANAAHSGLLPCDTAPGGP